MKWCFVVATATLLFAVGAIGCGSEPDHEFVDDGQVCFGDTFSGGDRSEVLPQEEPFEVSILIASCLSACNDETEPSDCSVELEGDTLTVTSYGAYSSSRPMWGTDCPDVCVEYGPTCEAPALDEGTYRLEHGDHTYEVEVPGEEAASNCLYEDDKVD